MYQGTKVYHPLFGFCYRLEAVKTQNKYLKTPWYPWYKKRNETNSHKRKT